MKLQHSVLNLDQNTDSPFPLLLGGGFASPLVGRGEKVHPEISKPFLMNAAEINPMPATHQLPYSLPI